MNENFEFYDDTYQTGRTAPPKRYSGLIAFLLVLVILLSGISTALSILNYKLYKDLTTAKLENPPMVSFSRTEDTPQPTEAVHEQVRELQEHLGISGTVIPPVYQRYYKLPQGIYVSRVADKSEAQEKGLVAGDIITALDGNAIQDDMLLDLWAETLEKGDTVTLKLYRSGSETELQLTWTDFD